MIKRISAAAGASVLAYYLVTTGRLTLDTGWGRRTRPLGPFGIDIAAPADTVFDVIAAPYLGRTPRALAGELRVLERGTDMVLAEHYTKASFGLVATTTETVRFERPNRVTFRLVRGPVPLVEETFELVAAGDGTRFEYTGELATDLWSIGSWWGARVASVWERTVERSLDKIAAEAEGRHAGVSA